MRRAGAWCPPALILACLVPGLLAGCGGRGDRSAAETGLTFEQLADTSGLSNGEPILGQFEVSRMQGGSLRVKARTRLPEGTRVEIAIRSGEGGPALTTTQAFVHSGELESPPMMPPTGPLPVARYRIELRALFTNAWQSPAVLRATDDGRSLRGPGITRTHVGAAMFWQVEEMTR